MRRLFLCYKSRETAKKRVPWAAIVTKVDGGFIAFESVVDWRDWKRQGRLASYSRYGAWWLDPQARRRAVT
jgi:hypothetical protein